MLKKTSGYIRKALVIWGAISLILVCLLSFAVAYNFTFGNRNASDQSTPKDVRYILNWCKLGDKRIESVLHSYVSSRSFTGDHLDAFAIKIKNVSIDELTASKDTELCGWYRCDQLPKLLDDAVVFAGGWSNSTETAWFPKTTELKSSDFYVYPWSIYYHGIKPSAVELIFIRPKDKMIFFMSVKT